MTSRRTGLVVVVVVAMVLVVLPVRPVAAHHAAPPENPAVGSGTVEGTELLEEQGLGNCGFLVSRQIFGWQGQGTYGGRTASGHDVVYKAELAEGQALHEGPLRFTVDTLGPYYHGPKGTHGRTDSTCSDATAGAPIDGARFTVFAEGHVYKLDGGGAQVPCTGGGSWARLGADWHGQWVLDADCVVVGNAAGVPGTGVAKVGTAHTHEGEHQPCGGSCVDNFKLDYSVHPPVEGLSVAMNGPASVAIGRSAPLTAVVAYDGVALSGASVVFSVAGPGAASPSGATATTGSSGEAAFSFTAPMEGDYVVTATATSPAYPGEEKAKTFTVFFSGPRPVMSLDAMPNVQNGDPATVVATIVDESDPVANLEPHDPVGGVTVSFSVAGPANGLATPASGTAATASNGDASFPFTADRAGAYTVTATAAYAGTLMTGTQTVHFDVKTFSAAGMFDLPTSTPGRGLMHPSGDSAYIGTSKVDLATGQVVGTISGVGFTTSAIISPGGAFAYYVRPGNGTASTSFGRGRIMKVDLSTLAVVATLELPAAEFGLQAPVIDPAGNFAYVVSAPVVNGQPFRNSFIKVDLNTFQRIDALSIPTYTAQHHSVMDPAGRYAYVTGKAEETTSVGGIGQLTKVDLLTFQLAGSLSFLEGETNVNAAVIDPAGDFAYLGAQDNSGVTGGARVVKVDLRTMERADTLLVKTRGFGTNSFLYPVYEGAVIDPAGDFAYFTGSSGSGVRVVVKVDVESMEQVAVLELGLPGSSEVLSALMDPGGEYVYFPARSGNTSSSTGHLVRFDVRRAPKAALVVGGESYATSYVTPLTVAAPGVLANDVDTEDGDGLVVFSAGDPAGGRVSLSPDGSFTYTPDVGFSGTDTFTYQASDGVDLSAPATVSVAVGAAPSSVASVSGGACGYLTKVGLFGGPQELKGCGQLEGATPSSSQVASRSASVTLPPTGSTAPLTASKPDGAIALYGPAALFGGIWPDDAAAPPPSGPLGAESVGATGPGGSVSSSARVVLHETPLPVRCDGDPVGTANCTAPGGAGPGPLIADEAHSECSASESGVSGSATFANGVVETKYDADTQLPIASIDIPTNPAPNFTVDGTLDHVGDSYRVVLNEQILGPDSITVNAAHVYLLGPTAVGELIVGQSRCGAELTAPNATPVAGDDAYTAGSGQVLTVPATGVLANDADGDGHPLRSSPLAAVAPPTSGGGQWGFPSDPAHGTLALAADGSFTYTPDAGYTGPDSFTYQAQDIRGATDPATVSLTVVPAPEAAGDAYTTTEDTSLVVAAPGVMANDTTPGGPLSAAKVSDPAHGSVVLAGDGSFSYTPAADYSGPDSFTYKVNDGVSNSDVATVDLTVTPVNDPPVAADDTYATASNTPLTVPAPGVLANDGDIDGGPLTAGSASDPAGGAVSVNADGSFTYTPDAGFIGADTFSYSAGDGQGGSVSALVTVAVAPPAGPPTLAAGDLRLPEGNAGATIATFTVTRSGTATAASTVKVKTSGGTGTAGTDYTAVPLTTVTFAPGETAVTVTVSVAGDTLPEKDETFNLVLSAPTGAAITDPSATATVVNDDGSAYLAVSSVTSTEGTPATFTVTRSGNTDGTSTAKYKTSGGTAGAGTDYTAAALTDLTFGPGQTAKTIIVPVAGDTADESNETFNLVLSAPSAGTQLADPSGAATIVDDEGTIVAGPTTFLAVDNLTVTEASTGTVAAFTVTRSGVTTGTSTVKAKTSGGTATAASDYAPLPLTTITFAPGEATKTVAIEVADDTAPEANETFNVVLSTPTGATVADASGTATILDDDPRAYLTIGNATLAEGDAGTATATFTVTRTGNTTAPSTVKCKTSGGSATAGTDYTAVPLTDLAFAAGETTKAVTVTIAGDAAVEANETFNLVLSAATGATVSDATGTGTITNDD